MVHCHFSNLHAAVGFIQGSITDVVAVVLFHVGRGLQIVPTLGALAGPFSASGSVRPISVASLQPSDV